MSSIEVEVPSVPVRSAARDLSTLVRLAVESWTDGCLGEGAAAAWATEASNRARDLELGGAAVGPRMRALAEDEARHSALAWDVLGWACAAGGDDVRHAVWAKREYEPALSDAELLSPARARRAGRLERSRMAALLERHVEGSRARLKSVLEG